ncbi:MAG: serine/threonine-protein kinase [Acidobacteriota bacterium]
MSSNRLERRALDLFQEALQIEPARRREFVDQRCRQDDALRAEVIDLLREASRVQDDFLEDPPFEAPRSGVTSSDTAPDRLGAFRVLEPLGEGGMGRVWLGLQERPIRRRVALKVMRRVHRPQARRRFAVECQALATLSHPNVATLYEAGETASGSPFVAMELVDGEDIATYCDHRNFGLKPRLELFRQVCAAVDHAHGKGILHRDLKPSNVLVTEVDGRPTAKVIDFGIAHIVDDSIVASVPAGDDPLIIGSPAYMSPEAANGSGAFDARSDVYSLGLLLYELLAGGLPFDVETQTKLLLQRRAGHVETPSPSERLGTLALGKQRHIASRRGLEPRTLRRRLRGDLDAVVSSAIAHDPEARYSTPSDLTADLEKHLKAQPISARSPTWSYRLGLGLRRSLVPAAMSVAALLILAFGLMMGTRTARTLDREARATPSPQATALALEPTRSPVGGVGINAEAFAIRSEADPRRAVAPKRQSHGDTHELALEAQSQHAERLVASGRWAEAIELLTEINRSLENRPRDSMTLLANNLLHLSRALEALGRLDPAYDAVDRAFDLFLPHEEDHIQEIIVSRLLRARILVGLGFLEPAMLESEETLEVILAAGPPHLDVEAAARRTLATSLSALGRKDEAERQRALAHRADELDAGGGSGRILALLRLDEPAQGG